MADSTDRVDRCPICSAQLDAGPTIARAGTHYSCPYCGDYGLTRLLQAPTHGELSISQSDRRLLKHLMAEHQLKRGSPIMLTSGRGGGQIDGKVLVNCEEFLSRYPRTPLEFFDRALENLSLRLNHPTGLFAPNALTYRTIFCEQQEGDDMLQQLSQSGFLSVTKRAVTDPTSGRTISSYVITAKGWQRIQDLKRPGRDSRQAFVAMWFDPSHAPFYTEGVKPAIEADGVTKAMRIDGKEHNDHIDDQIIAEIRRSRYLVADFRGHRAGVYFEAGFALGLGLPVIWTCHKSDLAAAHFDTRQYNHIEYEDPAELRGKLLNRIRATIT